MTLIKRITINIPKIMIMLFTIILFAITSLFIQNPEINIVLLSNLHPFHSVSQSDRQTAISAPYSLSLYTNNFKDIPFFSLNWLSAEGAKETRR